MHHQLDPILINLGIKSPSSLQLFKANALVVEAEKNTVIFSENKRNSNEYILLSGVAHRYNGDSKGKEVTTGFYLGGDVITPHFARTSKGKSIFSLQVLTDAVLAEIPVAALDGLRSQHREFYVFGQQVVENELSQAVQLEVIFRSFSAKERLLAMRKQYPNIENLVSHTVIASYLGITHVSFSRLRKELSGK